MGDLTKNLSRSEFECKCNYPECTRTPVDFDLPRVIQDCANRFASEQRSNLTFVRMAVHINSGYRCSAHNADEGGSATSAHLLGMAADFWMEYVYSGGVRSKVSDDSIADYLELTYPNEYGIGRYSGRTHIDTRPVAARWDKRND